MKNVHFALIFTALAFFIVSCGGKTDTGTGHEVFTGHDSGSGNDTKLIIPGQDIVSDPGTQTDLAVREIILPDGWQEDQGKTTDNGQRDTGNTVKDNGIKDTGPHTDTGCTHPGTYPAPSDPKDCSDSLKCGCGLPNCPANFKCYASKCRNQHCECLGCISGTCNQVTGKCEEDKSNCNNHTYCVNTFGANYYCGPNWKCVEKKPCMTDNDCYRRPEGQKCNKTTHECYNCTTNSDCGWDEFCKSGTCTKTPVNCNGVDYDNLGAADDVQNTGFVLRMIDTSAEFFAQPFPDCKANPAGIKTSFKAMNGASFISGGAGYFSAHFSGYNAKPKTLYIGFKGEMGFWRLPLSGSNTQSNIVLVLKQKFKKTPLTIYVIARESDGTWGDLAYRTLKIKEAGGGPLQVSILWTTDTDVDLHLEEPDGDDIYYGCGGINWNPQPNQPSCKTKTGGTLDIDSNAACGIDGIDNENIFFAGTPPNGQYIIRADYWDNCDENGATDFLVTLWKNGKLETFTGTFQASDANGGGAKSGRVIHTFMWP